MDLNCMKIFVYLDGFSVISACVYMLEKPAIALCLRFGRVWEIVIGALGLFPNLSIHALSLRHAWRSSLPTHISCGKGVWFRWPTIGGLVISHSGARRALTRANFPEPPRSLIDNQTRRPPPLLPAKRSAHQFDLSSSRQEGRGVFPSLPFSSLSCRNPTQCPLTLQLHARLFLTSRPTAAHSLERRPMRRAHRLHEPRRQTWWPTTKEARRRIRR